MLNIGFVLDTNGAGWRRLVEENSDDFGLEKDVEIWVLSVLEEGVDVAMSRILSLAIRTDISVPFLHPSVSTHEATVN